MTNKNKPAFPRSMISLNGPFSSSAYSDGYGMDLRDYFAAKAMQGMIGGKWPTTYGERLHISEFAYDMADAMMEARKE